MMVLRVSAPLVLLLVSLKIGLAQDDSRRANLKVYPSRQSVNQEGDVVFDCRDEGPLRLQVQWYRGEHLQDSHRGRMILRQVQPRHAGTYTCRAVGVPRTTAGAEVKASLQVLLNGVAPRLREPHQICTSMEAQCRNGECVPKEFVCDGEFDCTDGSDEMHCKSTTQTLTAWKPRVAELRAVALCDKDEGPCRNRKCIPIKFFCDGEFDCTDGSDEIHCNRTSAGKPPSHLWQRGKAENPNSDNEVTVVFSSAWSEWSSWGPCDRERCDQVRSRKCRIVSGSPCDGPATDRRKCPMIDCQMDGGWSAWTPWTSCSVSCGKGTRRRYRKCDNPAPNYGGAHCVGSDAQQRTCMEAFCVAESHWGPWEHWTPCSRTNNVTRMRKRLCEGGTSDCEGPNIEMAPCYPCPRNLKIGMKPVRITVPQNRLVNFTCHYRRRGDEGLSLELDLSSASHSNEVLKHYEHHIISDSLTATRCGARRRWTLLLGGGHSLVRCVVRDSQGQLLGKAESKVFSVPSSVLPCYGEKNCPEQRKTKPKKAWKKKPSSPIRNPKEMITKETIVKPVLPYGAPPRILQVHPSFQVVHQGSTAHIVCLATGDMPLDLEWHADGRELSPGAVTNGGFLQLTSIQPSDGGKYICTAKNSAGRAHSSATIVVT